MKIVDIKARTLKIPLFTTFRIALREVDYTEVVIARVMTDEGVVGYGEAAPEPCVTGETLDGILCALEFMKPTLIGLDPFAIEAAHGAMDRVLIGNPAAKCAIDLALYDIMGKVANLPVWRLIGGSDPRVVSDITVSIAEPDEMACRAAAHVAEGFHIIKTKVGIDPESDERAVASIRSAVGPEIRIRVDANQGYARPMAERMLRVFDSYGVEAAEQMLAAQDLEGSAALLERAGGVSIMLDEAIHSPADAARACALRAADVINIKLMKCGGLYPALQVNAVCEAHGVSCMVGCMLETPVGIMGGLSLAAARRNVEDSDCDSYRFYDAAQVPISGSFTESGDIVTLSDKPGLGVTVDLDF